MNASGIVNIVFMLRPGIYAAPAVNLFEQSFKHNCAKRLAEFMTGSAVKIDCPDPVRDDYIGAHCHDLFKLLQAYLNRDRAARRPGRTNDDLPRR